MWKKIQRLVFGSDCELRERMLRSIIVVGGIATIIGIAEILLIMHLDAILLTFLLLLLLAMGTSLFVMFKYGKFDLAATLIGLIIIVMVFPVLFLMSGALDGGPSVWMALGVFYICIMFTGKKMVAFLVLCGVMYGGTYLVAYYRPDFIAPMSSQAIAYVDSYFSIFAVGLCAGMILKVQMRVFEEEHKQNIAQREELERSSDSKNVFFANMSHEIRTPINSIIGLNEMILRSNPVGETREYAIDIQLASKMLLNQINDILDLSQMEMKKMRVVPVEYRTEVLFSELIEMIRIQMEKKKLELYIDIDKNLPSVLLGDEKRIKQVLLNILDNAVKYTLEGSVTLSVTGEQIGDGEVLLKVEVADTGIGIRKEDIEYLYDSFKRVDENRTTRIVGSGLGLAITKQLVDLMDGEITVDSIYTKGTSFTVTLAQKIVDKHPIGTVDFHHRKVVEGEFYKPGFVAPEARVLVVDDNDMNAIVVQRLLSYTKVQVDVAHSGMECLDMTKKKFYHVILLDYMMPGMNGLDTLEALRNQENGLCREASVIALTANSGPEVRTQYQSEGFDGYVEKPVQGRLLEKEIVQFLPPEILELQDSSIEVSRDEFLRKTARRRRKKVSITADCVCDIPGDLLEKYDIKLMYLYIKTPHGRFADTREIDSDSLSQYMTTDYSSVQSDSVTVQELEEFFAECLTEAEEVIHIAMASGVGRSYESAVMAAKSFDHVHVIDSEQVSGGMGLVVLGAAWAAVAGKSVDEICEEVERIKKKVQTRFIMPGADVFWRSGRTSSLVAWICRHLQLHPVVVTHQKRVELSMLLGGSLESAWRQGIRIHLRKRRKISRQIIVITHVGCTVKQLEWIADEVKKRVEFERVIIQKASLTVACSSGMESIGIAYYEL